MSNENTHLEDNLWSSFPQSATELSIGSKLTNSNGITLEKVSAETWEYKAGANKISYNNGVVDTIKQISTISFNVEIN